MKSAFFFILIFLVTLVNSPFLLSQEKIKFAINGDTTVVPTKDFDNFSLKIPESLDVSEMNGTIVIKMAFETNFAVVLMVNYKKKKSDADLQDLLKSHIDLYGKNGKWDLDKIYKFKEEELKLGNSINGYMVNGIRTDKAPMKLYNTIAAFESADKEQMIIFVSGISVNPDHELYNNFNEIRNYMYDIKVMMSSITFKK